MERRYGVPASTLMAVNGFNSASAVRPGTKVIIPVYNAAGTKASAKSSARELTTASIAQPRSRVVVPPARPKLNTRSARDNSSRLRAPVARPRIAQPHDKHNGSRTARNVRKVGPVLNRETLAERKARIRAERTAKAEERRELARREALRKDRRLARRQQLAKRKEEAAEKARVAKLRAERSRSARAGSSEPRQSRSNVDRNPVGSINAASTNNFRWPTKGRIIQGFRKNGNDGINIAVPEGTPVKAAEGGTVAYAGSELKGYGNLVLIRHPNGYVSAYAHNSQLKVKRGDTVRRGQLIAKAGRTGNVSTPQLHFELRKGSKPVNPVNLLGSN
ncbi:MAG: LysM peptidoglycan-binding domain-containing M23 family metallopeptidase [Hyphomicrobiales bacterium]|nr:LysM peptidoglycan-binding domain-containing M23 family metallopeptidase [Hyphomicrobiales bacterium]